MSFQGKAAAFDILSGQTLWQRDMSSYRDFALDLNTVYITDANDVVWALDKQNGKPLWSEEQLQRRGLTAPAVWNHYIVVGDFEGYLHFIDKNSGKIVGRVRPFGDAIDATPLVVDDYLYTISVDGKLISYRLL